MLANLGSPIVTWLGRHILWPKVDLCPLKQGNRDQQLVLATHKATVLTNLIMPYCHFSAIMTDVFHAFFLSWKANARVQLSKRGHGQHSSHVRFHRDLFYLNFKQDHCGFKTQKAFQPRQCPSIRPVASSWAMVLILPKSKSSSGTGNR